MNPNYRRVILGSLLAGYLVADLLVALVLRVQGSEILAGLLLGLIFAQATLIAVWTSWGDARAIVRIGTGTLLIGLVTAAVLAMGLRDTSPSEAIAIAIAVPAQWLAVQLPLWVFRLMCDERLIIDGANPPARLSKDSQFGLKQLLVWMLILGIVMGIARAVLPRDVLQGNRVGARETLAIVLTLLVFNSLLAWPMIWATLRSRLLLVWIPIAVVCGIIITFCEIGIFNATMPGGDGEIFYVLNASQYLFVGGSLLLARLCGYRLRCAGPSETVHGQASPIASD